MEKGGGGNVVRKNVSMTQKDTPEDTRSPFKQKKDSSESPKSLLLLVELSGIEPLAYALRTHRSPN